MHQPPGEQTDSSKIDWLFNLCIEMDSKALMGSMGKMLIRNVGHRLSRRLKIRKYKM